MLRKLTNEVLDLDNEREMEVFLRQAISEGMERVTGTEDTVPAVSY